MTNIVMVTRDRPKLFQQAVRSLYDTTNPQDFTLLVFDDCSVTPALPDNRADNCRVLRAEASTHILGELKSRAVRLSISMFGFGDWLCLCDNDVCFLPGWLDRITLLAERSEPLGFRLWGGQNHPYHMTPNFSHPVAEVPGLIESYTLAGTHMFMEWDTWHQYQNTFLSEGPGVCRGEDVLFCRYIAEAHGRIGVSSPEVVIDCGITQTGGSDSPGSDTKRTRMVEGVYYE